MIWIPQMGYEYQKNLQEEENRIKGISFRVCQEHYDKRHARGQANFDEIVAQKECYFCNKLINKLTNAQQGKKE